MLQINLVAALAALPLLLGLGTAPAAAPVSTPAAATPASEVQAAALQPASARNDSALKNSVQEVKMQPAKVSPPATSPSVKVVDTTAAISDPAWFKKAYDAGIRLYVMHSTAWGTCDPWYRTQAQLKMALDAGLKIAVYTRDASCWRGGISAAGPYAAQLQFFALDVEPASPPVTREMVDGVRSMGVRPVIYSGSGMWPDLMGSSTAFADVPLWDTNTASNLNYSTWTADYLAPTPVQYGGWNTSSTMRIGIQQKFEQSLNGIPVDLNSFNASFLM
ncbi:hypothetical protein LJR078_003192 [Arthrobacter sp. LjRoot78]|uniref:hypothetical protein n=1 Tax=Arthrobacter sp. LjRoot78 TaxID=3342338 RepID=UPI003ECC71F6